MAMELKVEGSFVDDFFILQKSNAQREKPKQRYNRKFLKSLDLSQQKISKNIIGGKKLNQTRLSNHILEETLTYSKNQPFKNKQTAQAQKYIYQEQLLYKSKNNNLLLDNDNDKHEDQAKNIKLKMKIKRFKTLSYEEQDKQKQTNLIHNLNKKFRKLIDINFDSINTHDQKKNKIDRLKMYKKSTNKQTKQIKQIEQIKKQIKSLDKYKCSKQSLSISSLQKTKQQRDRQIIRIHKIKSSQNIAELMQRQWHKRQVKQKQYQTFKQQQTDYFDQFSDKMYQEQEQQPENKQQNFSILQNQKIKNKLNSLLAFRKIQGNLRLNNFQSAYMKLKKQCHSIIEQTNQYRLQKGKKIERQKRYKELKI